ncbi:hypothetical protein EXW83_29615, partial [Klebsiella pneumoniae]|nr:hypothetical protein [Klebsiella pneumoniae]
MQTSRKEGGMDALATANDMNRHVLCTAHKEEEKRKEEEEEWANTRAENLLKLTREEEESWLDQKKVATT